MGSMGSMDSMGSMGKVAASPRVYMGRCLKVVFKSQVS